MVGAPGTVDRGGVGVKGRQRMGSGWGARRLPPDLVDYVLCHDLLHLRVPDHSKGFRVMMGCYIPDWRKRELALAGWLAWNDKRRQA